MRTAILTAAVLAIGGAASAQELEVEHAAARLVVIPEARTDVQVTVTPGRAGLPPLQVERRRDGSVEIDGGLERRIQGCSNLERGGANQATVRVRGVGNVRAADLPVITARVPLDADVSAGGAVFGTVGRTRSLDLAVASCGDWSVANVAGALQISAAGSGDVVTGTSAGAEVSLAGSGDVRLGAVAGRLRASIAGWGDVRAVSVAGSLNASIAGSGDVIVDSGRTGPVSASIVGSGDVRLAGAAQSVSASIMGSGDVRVGQVLGPVNRSVMGSGQVIVGR